MAGVCVLGGGGVCWGSCVAGHAWLGACMAGGMCGGRHAWWGGACVAGGACMAGGVCGRGEGVCMVGGCVACIPPSSRYYEIP